MSVVEEKGESDGSPGRRRCVPTGSAWNKSRILQHTQSSRIGPAELRPACERTGGQPLSSSLEPSGCSFFLAQFIVVKASAGECASGFSRARGSSGGEGRSRSVWQPCRRRPKSPLPRLVGPFKNDRHIWLLLGPSCLRDGTARAEWATCPTRPSDWVKDSTGSCSWSSPPLPCGRVDESGGPGSRASS